MGHYVKAQRVAVAGANRGGHDNHDCQAGPQVPAVSARCAASRHLVCAPAHRPIPAKNWQCNSPAPARGAPAPLALNCPTTQRSKSAVMCRGHQAKRLAATHDGVTLKRDRHSEAQTAQARQGMSSKRSGQRKTATPLRRYSANPTGISSLPQAAQGRGLL